jgi:hypothetical protein
MQDVQILNFDEQMPKKKKKKNKEKKSKLGNIKSPFLLINMLYLLILNRASSKTSE